MEFNPAFDTNVCIYLFKVVSSLIEFAFSFLTVGAGFALNKAKLFPTEAARGGAQVVLVQQFTMCMSCTAKLISFFIGRMSPCHASSSPISFLRLVRTTSARWRRWRSLE
jgi:hypothetical protein